MDDQKYYNLSAEEYQKLNAFVGYGDIPNASIIFLGNEEGLAGSNVRTGVKARLEMFGGDPDYYINREDWTQGYFELGINSYKKTKEYLEGAGEPDIERKNSIPILEFQTRLIHYLQDTNDKWFRSRTEDDRTFEIVKNYYLNHTLYSEIDSFKTALLDLRPLPRHTQDQRGDLWPYPSINEKDYYRAFHFTRPIKPKFTNSQTYRMDRVRVLKNAICASKAPLIIGIGDRNNKKHFILDYLLDEKENVKIEERPLTKEKIEVCIMKNACIGNIQRTIILSDFFNHWDGIKLKGLQILATIIKDIGLPIV